MKEVRGRETFTNDDGKNDENHHNDNDGKLHVLPVHLLVDLLAASLKRLGVLGKGLCATNFKRSKLPPPTAPFRIDGSKTAPSSHTSCREFPQESTVHKEEEEEEEESQSYQS